jgi:hypothetical protein
MNRSRYVALAATLALALAGCASPGTEPSAAPSSAATPPGTSSSPAASEREAAADPLLAYELVDVRSGESFTLGELAADGPVLFETMAIWCTSCLQQQREVVVAHDLAEFTSVGIDVDPNERGPDLAGYAEREGFDWRYVIADQELVALLTERFGFQVTNPPSTPTFIVSPGGTIRALEFNRIRSAEELVSEIEAG